MPEGSWMVAAVQRTRISPTTKPAIAAAAATIAATRQENPGAPPCPRDPPVQPPSGSISKYLLARSPSTVPARRLHGSYTTGTAVRVTAAQLPPA